MKFSYLVYEPVTDLAELTRRMRRVAELGYDGIELTATHPLGFSIDELLATSQEIGLPVVSLLSGWSYASEGLCLSSPSADIRQQTVARLIEYVALAERLGALLVVGLLQGLRADEPNEQSANQRIAESLRQVARVAEAKQVSIVVEPVNHLQVGFNHTAREVAELVERIGSTAVSPMLDTIHMHIEERSPLDTIGQYAWQIGHFHLCESNGADFGTGNLDFAAILSTLAATGYDKYVSIKVYRGANWEDGARSAIEFLRTLGVK